VTLWNSREQLILRPSASSSSSSEAAASPPTPANRTRQSEKIEQPADSSSSSMWRSPLVEESGFVFEDNESHNLLIELHLGLGGGFGGAMKQAQTKKATSSIESLFCSPSARGDDDDDEEDDDERQKRACECKSVSWRLFFEGRIIQRY
jgi:hypothetical protein